MKYHRSVLEAKLYLGNNLVCSIASEPIQNSEEYINQREEEVKNRIVKAKRLSDLQKKDQETFSKTSNYHNSRWVVCLPEGDTDLY